MHTAIDDLIDAPAAGPSAAERWLTRIVGLRRLRAICFLVLGVVLWSDIVREGWWPRDVLPGPIDVGSALIAGLRHGVYLDALASSLRTLAIGYGMAAVMGVLLGVMLAAHDAVEDMLGWLVAAVRALPGVCWLPLAGLWLGWNERAVIVAVAMGSLVPILTGVNRGIRTATAAVGDAKRPPGTRRSTLAWQVGVPAALPVLITGLARGWALAWPSLLAAELITRSMGLGTLLQMEPAPDSIASVLAVMGLIVAVGASVNLGLFTPLERRARAAGLDTRRWRVEQPEPAQTGPAASRL